MVLLGIDYGCRRIGLALSVNSVIETKGFLDLKKIKNDVFIEIQAICLENKVDKLVMGISDGLMKEKSLEFGNKLTKMLELPVVFINETLTSIEAIRMVGERKKGRIDSVSAALILQSYLDINGEN